MKKPKRFYIEKNGIFTLYGAILILGGGFDSKGIFMEYEELFNDEPPQ